MKNKILSKAYGGVTEARRKLYGLGLPRQWKVITSTLLLLFTFAIGNVWADTELCSASISDITATANTTGVAQTGCTMKWNAVTITASDIVTISGVNYRKFTGSGSYVQLILTSGNFQEGDVLTVILAGKDSSKKTVEFSLKADDGNSASGSASKTVTDAVTYTLTAGDIETDGSIKIFRHGSSNSRYGSFSVVRPAECTETAPISVAVSGGATYDKGDALSNLSAAVTGGTGTMSYQWYRNTTNAATISDDLKLANCTTATLTPANKVGTYYYYCVASNCAGSVTSGTTAVTINPVCPPSGTIYKFQVKTGLTSGNLVTSVPKDVDMTTDNYLSALVGGELMAAARANVNRINITGGNAIGFANGADAYLEMTLDCAIQAGDIIKYTVANANMLVRLTSASTEENQLTLDRTKTQVEVPAAFVGATKLYMIRAGSSPNISYFEVFRPVYRTITLEYADGVTPDGSIKVLDGEAATKPSDPTWEHHRFDGWYDGSDPYDWSETVGGDLTLTAHWTQLYTITYAAGDGTATGDAPTQVDKAATETFTVAANSFAVAGKVFDYWNDGTNDYNPGNTYTVGTNNVTLTAVWRTPSTMYAITKGAHENGDFTIDPASQEAGEVVTLEATPNDGYLFGAWEVVKTEDASATGITVDANGQFTMPGYAVTVNATFVVDPRKKILYVTGTAEETVKANDKLYAALKDDYRVTIVGPTSDADQTSYDLVVLHESVGGGNYGAAAVVAAKAGNTPVLNTKTYFYGNTNDASQRWQWGAPNAGQTVNGATLNSAYCNVASHPLFSGVTMTAGFFEITDDAAAKCMQPIGSFTSGKEGYILATTPNAGEGNGCAIHELTPAQRGASAGKYLMISVSNAKLDALNANGQKLFQNAAAYLLDGSASWTPIPALSDPAIAATPSATYAAGDNISLAASATGSIATTTYTWYKGATWAEAETAGAIQAAKTAAESGNVYAKASCAVGDAGTYWCVMSNGTGCDVNASLAVTVSDASYNITFVSAHGTAPVATSGVSYTLSELTESGWAHQGWTASIDVTVDEAVVTAGTTIANGKVASFGADVTFTAVWAQVFEVTFNKNGHGDDIDPQNIVSGGKVTKPADPSESGWIFGGWFTDNGTFEAPFDFNTLITAATPLYAKWTEDPCPTPFSLSKVVLTSASDGTVTGYNGNEYAGEKVIGGLSGTQTAEVDPSHEGLETGYKLNSGGSAIVFATLKKGTFQEGDRVVITITKKQDAYKVEEVAQPILDIYYGTDKNDATFLTTLEGVSAAGTYTYRLTAADVTAIGTKKGIGVFRPSSGRTQNPYIYSVEIQGCRSWAVSHQVTYNMMGHGTQVDPQSVPEGDLLTKPTVVEPEGWAFVGWYKENTLENEWDFTTDVMGTSDMTLYAKWEDETSAIKLIVDDVTPGSKKINDEAYYTGSPLTSVTISEVETPCVKLAGGATAATAPYSADKNDNRVIAYCAQTTQTKIRVTAYSNTNSARPYTISFVEEGQTADQADDNNVIVNLPTDGTIHTTDWYTFNSDKNRTIYITIPGNASNYHFLQVKVIESGTPIKKAGDLGYSMNFNVGRPIGIKQTLHKNFEGFDFYANNDYKVLQSTSMAISNATNDYIKFHAAVPMTLAVTTENAASFYVTKAAKGTDNETLSTAGGISYIDLDEAADWYISPKGGDVKIQKIEFIAPKCQQPTVVDMENIGLCEGDAFTALTVSASVSDGGTLHYQWYKHPAAGDDEAVGTDAASYTPEADGQYYVVVTNKLAEHSDNSKASNMVTVEHFSSAEITTAPLNKRGEVDDVVTLSVVATGKNLSYKWFKCDDESGTNPVAIDPEETNASLNVTITAGMNQWYKVLVTSDCGNAEATARVSEFEPTAPANVTGSITWDWKSTTAGFPTENTSIDFTNTSVEELFADVDAAMPNNEYFRSDMLYGIGQRAWRKSNNDGECGFQGFQIRFNTEVAGRVRVYFRAPSSGQTSAVTIDGKPAGSRGNSWGWSEYVDVEASTNVIIAMTNGETGMTRVQKIEFEERVDQRGAGWAAAGELGTVCLESDAVVTGANLYELAGLDVNGYLAFDQILNGELEAGKPYLFEATSNALINFYAPVNAGTADQAEVTNGMHGTFTNKTFTASDESIYYFSGRHIWAVKDFIVSITIPAHYCYVDMSELQNSGASEAPAPGRRRISMSIMGSQIATGIENTGFESEAPRKVLINGELYILRGEKMYDAKGQLVK